MLSRTLCRTVAACLLGGRLTVTMADSTRTTLDFNADWQFLHGDPQAAQAIDFDDSNWRTLRVPHDWSIETSHTQEGAGGSTAFLRGGIGWYRKSFNLPMTPCAWIVFDGVYNNARIWINGRELESHPYGYSPFTRELTPYLMTDGQPNVVAVRVDRSAYIDCRWYPGSGIYRDVKLITTGDVYIPQWGTFLTTPVVTPGEAEVRVRTAIRNTRSTAANVELRTRIVAPDGKEVARAVTPAQIAAGDTWHGDRRIRVTSPDRWDVDHPVLYRAEQDVVSGDQVLDSLLCSFGVRSIRYDARDGFFLNGTRRLFKGVCLHHDGGCVGAAVPDGVWERRLRTLKAIGCNAIRTAHNPPSEAFLDLCDRMGFLVQDEAFDEWDNPKDKRKNYHQQSSDEETRGYTEHFAEWAQRDVQSMVLRDRNHPSIVMWSIGNEIEWTYPRYGQATGYWTDGPGGDLYYLDEPPHDPDTIRKQFHASSPRGPILAETARKLADWTRELDRSRPVTANLVIPSVSHFSGFTDALDIVGYSYRRAVYDCIHEQYPDTFMVGTENWPQWEEWQPVLEKDFIHGIFLWTGINYLGEANRWPTRGSGSGLLDFAGFVKPCGWMFQTLWSDKPTVRMFTAPFAVSNYRYDLTSNRIEERPDRPRAWKWGWAGVHEQWNYETGEEIYVEAYANCDEVELLLEGQSLGVQRLVDQPDRIFKWGVPFTPGSLIARGKTVGGMVTEHRLQTAGEPASIALSVEGDGLERGHQDVAHLVAQVVDAAGIPVRHREFDVSFAVEGDARNIGVDNGSTRITQDAKSDTCRTAQGRCLMILQAGATPGPVTVTAAAPSLGPATVRIDQR